jgi:glycine/D-amino acid oxidase-like deaminating enzyme
MQYGVSRETAIPGELDTRFGVPMNRRTMLKMAGMAALGLGLGIGSGCSLTRPTVCADAEIGRRFSKVKVSPARVIRTVAGLRPYRPSGFVVGADRSGGKTIIHNYGHGGGGVSLSWGTSHLAVEEAVKAGAGNCAVIGCGCVGLSTARLLQRRGFPVTIYARDLPPYTTSNVAGALWSPFAVADLDQCTPAFAAQLEYATRLSHRYFLDLVGDAYGVRWIESFILGSKPIERPPETQSIRDLYLDAADLAPDEHPFPAPYAHRFSTLLIDMPVYLNALVRDVTQAGGKIVASEFRDRDEILNLPEPVIVNCTGLGAGQLFGDHELMPIKGQLTHLLPQPEVDYVTICRDEHLSMIPRRDAILLGGTFEPDEWSLEPNQTAAESIVEGHRRFFGSLKECPGEGRNG